MLLRQPDVVGDSDEVSDSDVASDSDVVRAFSRRGRPAGLGPALPATRGTTSRPLRRHFCFPAQGDRELIDELLVCLRK